MNKRGHNDTLKPPPRWLNCPRRGSIIHDLFVPFKTPLDSRYDSVVPPEKRFPPSWFISACRDTRNDRNEPIRIGLWIDLTYTSRFYDKSEVTDESIEYVKLACRGHNAAPTTDQIDNFIRLCGKFARDKPGQAIAVHCTHGFNRTGYLICAYLVQCEGCEPRAAINMFARARPPGIYKQDYLNDFYKRYSDSDDVPMAPELPEWCFEEDEDDGDDDGGSQSLKRSRREFTKTNPVFMAGVPGVTHVSEFNELSRIRWKVQSLVQWNSTGFPGAQPVSLSSQNIHMLKSSRYMVSWKADGTRYMMLIEDRDKIYFIDRDNSVFQLHNVTFPSYKIEEHLIDTLVDGEMVLDADGHGGTIPRYLIYDVIVYNRTDHVGQKNFQCRFDCILKGIIKPRSQAMKMGLIDRSKEPIGIRRKDFFDLSATEKVMKMDTCHQHDGLIFQPVDEPYTGGRCPRILKWKPAELNSIDFKCAVYTTRSEGCLPETVAGLYVLGMPDPFATIVIKKDMKRQFEEYNGKIVECECTDLTRNQWKVMRIRTDKSHANSINTAQGVLQSIRDGYDKDFMLRFIRDITGGPHRSNQHHQQQMPHPNDHHHQRHPHQHNNNHVNNNNINHNSRSSSNSEFRLPPPPPR